MSVRNLPKELVEKARVELDEDPKRLQDGLNILKDWAAKQPHLRIRTDDQWLAAFLRGCKFSIERAKQKLDLFYTVQTTAPELFRHKHTDPLFNEMLETGTFFILPKPSTSDGPSIGFFRFGAIDVEKYKFTDIMSVTHVLTKIMLIDNDNAVVAGVQSIIDLKGVNKNIFLQITPTDVKKMIVYGQDATPIRTKGSYYINVPSGLETMFGLMKSFLNEKNRNRVYVYGDEFEEIYNNIPKSIMPAEYGGDGGTIKEIIDYWKKKIEEYGPWLKDDEQYGTDETKRPGKPKTVEDMYGIEGSFRKLEFD